MKVNPHRSSLGMDANVMALLCYIGAFVLSWIPVIQWVAPAAPLVIFFINRLGRSSCSYDHLHDHRHRYDGFCHHRARQGIRLL